MNRNLRKIVCFGDSNTFGYVPGVGGRFDAEHRWTGILQQAAAGQGLAIIEEGLNGRTTIFDDDVSPDRNGLKELEGVLRRNAPLDGFVMMLGTNDCKIKFHADVSAIAGGLEKLLQVIRQFDEHIRIWICSPAVINEGVKTGIFAHNFDDESIRKSRELGAAFSELAQRYGCGFWDAAEEIFTDPSDGIHLSAEAHRRLAGVLLQKLTETA